MINKIKILTKIATLLNDANVLYNVGGSAMLYLRDYPIDFNDIDIMVSESAALNVKKLLSKLGQLLPQKNSNNLGTKYFFSFLIDGVHVDLMAGFTIIYQNKSYYFPLDNTTKVDMVLLDGIQIKIASLEDWLTYYKLMERTDKVKMIESIMNF